MFFAFDNPTLRFACLPLSVRKRFFMRDIAFVITHHYFLTTQI